MVRPLSILRGIGYDRGASMATHAPPGGFAFPLLDGRSHFFALPFPSSR